MDIGCLVVAKFPLACELADRPQLVGQPLAVARPRQAVILVASAEAERWGVAPGQSVTEALGRCPDMEILDPRPSRYAVMAESIATALEIVAPGTEPAAEGLCYVDLRGLANVHGSDAAMHRALLGAVPAALQPRLGIAPSKFSALVAATDALPGDVLVLTDSAAATHLSDHSVAVLPVDDETLRRLHLLGLETLGDIASMTAATLSAQFGAVGARIHRLARGIDNDPVSPRAWREEVVETLEPEAPLSTAEPLILAVDHLLGRACHSAAFRGRASRQALLTLATEDGRSWQRAITFKQALSEPRRIAEMLRAPLLGAQLPGPITSLRLELSALVWAQGWQVHLLGEQAERRVELDEGLRKLRAQFGFCPIAHVVDVEPWNRIPERRLALTDLIS